MLRFIVEQPNRYFDHVEALFSVCSLVTDEKKAEKMDKKIIWEHTNYFRIKSSG